MASLKELRGRIGSVKQTQKITSAMKLVAASKLRRAQDQAEASRPFASRMADMLANLAAGVADVQGAPPLLAGTGNDNVHLLVVATADRGLCGAFNSSIARGARRRIRELQEQAKGVKLLCVGRKGRDALRRDYGHLIEDTIEGVGRRRLEYAEARAIAERLERLYADGAFDVCTIIYNRFRSAITQELTFHQLIPVAPAAVEEGEAGDEIGERDLHERVPEALEPADHVHAEQAEQRDDDRDPRHPGGDLREAPRARALVERHEPRETATGRSVHVSAPGRGVRSVRPGSPARRRS